MTITATEAAARLQSLLEDLESGSWVPTRLEQRCAEVILDAPPRTPPVEAVVEGMRAAGPGIAPPGEANPYATALVQAATLLRTNGFPTSPDGQQLLGDLRALLLAVTGRMPLPPPWASRSR
ncbi:hypothetical protein AB0D34_45230 [Streptomyces sp. NPDC048420]|uniref:hypothetical protein n=1 Tax=Streptomyces sp. NPDC048420 TaxID=3155755 RepID=UPI0034251D5E